MVFKCLDQSEVTVQGIRSDPLSKIISAMQARRFLKKGCEAFFALVLDSKRSQVKLDDIPVVKEFPDVFPEELPGLPLKKKVDCPLKFYRERLLFPRHLIGWLQLNYRS